MIKGTKKLAIVLGYPYSGLLHIGDNIADHYREWKKLKRNRTESSKIRQGNEPYRIINDPTDVLRKVQSRIKTRIFSKIPLSANVTGGIKGSDNIRNANAHLGKKFKFVTDLSNFYPSISNARVYAALTDLGFSADVSRTLTRLVTYKGSVPQGALTSTHIANLVFQPIDNRLIEFCKQRGITYTRYIDDLTFSSSECFESVTNDIIRVITEGGFRINHRKTHYKIGPATITGVVTRNNVLRERADQQMRARDSILTDKQRIGLESYINRVRNHGR